MVPKGQESRGRNDRSEIPAERIPSASYLQRTEWNVRDSDATVLFSIGPSLSGGSKKTVEFARKHNKPCLHLHARLQDAAQRLRAFLEDNVVETLNVAGPRASKEPNVAEFVIETFERVFGGVRMPPKP